MITVNNTNDLPYVNKPIPDQSAFEDTAFDFTFDERSFDDIDISDTLSYSAVLENGHTLPSWLTFDSSLRQFIGTPKNNDVGTITVLITATDRASESVSDSFMLTINNTNDAPTLENEIPDRVAYEASLFDFTFDENTFVDVDLSDSLSYSAILENGQSLPSWLVFTPSTRNFSGTPTNDHIGTIQIKVTATDESSESVFDIFMMTINNENDVPTLVNEIPDQTIDEDVAFNFTFSEDTFNDVDINDILSYTSELENGNALPSWLTFISTQRTFNGTPGNDDVGTITIKVTAIDGASTTVADWFTITINNINDAPTLENEIADQSINEDDEFTLIINPDTFQEIDAGDYLIYTATLADDNRLPAWLNFNSSNRSFSGTPLNEDVGIISVKMSATDQSLATVYNIFSITIHNTNDAPTLENEIPDQVAYEASVFDFTFDENTFKDIDLSDSLSYSAALVDGQPLPLWLSFDYSARNFIGIPTNDDIGTIQIKITATDGSSERISDVFMITINNENDVPTLVNEIPDQTVDEDIAFDFTFSEDTFNDVDTNDILSYTAELENGSPLPSWLTFISSKRNFNGTPANDDVGIITIKVTAMDGASTTVSDWFTMTINNINDAPTLDNEISDQIINEDDEFALTFNENTFQEIDPGDFLVYTATLEDGHRLPSWLSFDPSNRTFIGTPLNEDVGMITVKVIAADQSLATAHDIFAMTIHNTNDSPVVLNTIPDQMALEDSQYHFVFNVNTFDEVDKDDYLTYSATQEDGTDLPPWLSFDKSTRRFSGTPLNEDVAVLRIKVTAIDTTSLSVSDIFSLTVANVNDPPTLEKPFPDQTVTEGVEFHITIPEDTFNDVDANDSLTYTATLQGIPLDMFDPSTRTFNSTGFYESIGSFTIVVIATDQSYSSAQDDFVLTVAHKNNPPLVLYEIPDQWHPSFSMKSS
jgi:hypothetical protein